MPYLNVLAGILSIPWLTKEARTLDLKDGKFGDRLRALQVWTLEVLSCQNKKAGFARMNESVCTDFASSTYIIIYGYILCSKAKYICKVFLKVLFYFLFYFSFCFWKVYFVKVGLSGEHENGFMQKSLEPLSLLPNDVCPKVSFKRRRLETNLVEWTEAKWIS